MKNAAPGLLFLAALFCLPSCGKDAESPEERVRSLVAQAEEAVETKEISVIRDLIAEDYSDDRGNDRQGLLGILCYHFLRNDALHLLVRVDSVQFPSPGTAEVTAIAAMAGEPIPTAEALGSLRADIYRFDVVLSAEGTEAFLLRSAQWRRATPGDFF